ncbi:MAG: DNA gyrase inhibitor YacG [Pseudomonadota bacterium]
MTCPICQRPTCENYRPFCSKRCADVDLGKWLSGSYVIESDEPDPDNPEPDSPSRPH